MNLRGIALITCVVISGCAADPASEAPYDPLADYEEVDATTILDVGRIDLNLIAYLLLFYNQSSGFRYYLFVGSFKIKVFREVIPTGVRSPEIDTHPLSFLFS